MKLERREKQVDEGIRQTSMAIGNLSISLEGENKQLVKFFILRRIDFLIIFDYSTRAFIIRTSWKKEKKKLLSRVMFIIEKKKKISKQIVIGRRSQMSSQASYCNNQVEHEFVYLSMVRILNRQYGVFE